jgi:hypothetical protein
VRAATTTRLRLVPSAYWAFVSGFTLALSTATRFFSISEDMPCGKALSTDATRVESVRSTFARAGVIIFTAVSILPAIGAKTDDDMASSAIATIMPPWA